MEVSLRPVRADDSEFLFRLYSSTRAAELAALAWDPAQQKAFLQMQFNAQQRWYATMYPGAEEQVVVLGETPIGRMIVYRGAETTSLVDIALLPEHRGRGVGGGLVGGLVEQCRKRGVALRLQVLRTNPAARLYERLGFRKSSEDEMYMQMEKLPG